MFKMIYRVLEHSDNDEEAYICRTGQRSLDGQLKAVAEHFNELSPGVEWPLTFRIWKQEVLLGDFRIAKETFAIFVPNLTPVLPATSG